ncbi:MAG: helix-turn-helix domain-containing protein [Pseudomonas profundi]|uniref:helix-turn-helix domain-containing protein n=1 Tax=Pseudomonas profundi TaxID=1981513 RepID=UPI0030028304
MNRKLILTVFALRLDADLKIILLYLAFHTNTHGYAWPKIARLAEAVNQSRRTVQRKLSLLVAQGLLEIGVRTAEGGRQTSNWYRLLVPLTDRDVAASEVPNNTPDLSPSRVTVKVSPQEVLNERKPSGVTAGRSVGKEYLRQLQNRLKGSGFISMVKRGQQQ